MNPVKMDFFSETPHRALDKKRFIQTASGNTVSRKSILCGSQNIHLSGKTIVEDEAMMRGDLSRVTIGRYSVIEQGVVLRPPSKYLKGSLVFVAQSVGDYVFVGRDSVVQAASIGSYVYIGKDCVVSERVVIHDCCFIEDGCVIPPDAVIPPFTRVTGVPGVMVDEMPESTPELFRSRLIRHYEAYTGSAT